MIAPISVFIKSIFKDEVVFVEGNNNLGKATKGYSKVSDCVLVFLDCVYDNERTFEIYNELFQDYCNKDSNVFLVKIPCIEYIALVALLYSGTIRETGLVKLFVKSQTTRVQHGYQSYEKFCKSVLNEYKLSCIRNQMSKRLSVYTGVKIVDSVESANT